MKGPSIAIGSSGAKFGWDLGDLCDLWKRTYRGLFEVRQRHGPLLVLAGVFAQ